MLIQSLKVIIYQVMVLRTETEHNLIVLFFGDISLFLAFRKENCILR